MHAIRIFPMKKKEPRDSRAVKNTTESKNPDPDQEHTQAKTVPNVLQLNE